MQTSWAPCSWKDCFSADHQHTGTAGRQRGRAGAAVCRGSGCCAHSSPPLPGAPRSPEPPPRSTARGRRPPALQPPALPRAGWHRAPSPALVFCHGVRAAHAAGLPVPSVAAAEPLVLGLGQGWGWKAAPQPRWGQQVDVALGSVPRPLPGLAAWLAGRCPRARLLVNKCTGLRAAPRPGHQLGGGH